MMKSLLKLTLFAAAAAAFTAAPALADTLNVTLNTPAITLAPGATYAFVGTLSAPLTNSAVQNLGDALNPDAPLVGDDTDFLNNAPLTLAPGASYTGALFTISLPGTVGVGTYAGIFDVLGNDSTVFGSARFTVNTASATAVTPEPSSWLLLATGCGVAGLLRRRLAGAA